MALNTGPWIFLINGNCYQLNLNVDGEGNVNGQFFSSASGYPANTPAAGVVNVGGNWDEGTQTLTLTFTLGARPVSDPAEAGGNQYNLVGVQFGVSYCDEFTLALAGTFKWTQVAILGETPRLPIPSGSGRWIALVPMIEPPGAKWH